MVNYGNELVGTSPAIETLRRLVERIGSSPTRTVLIYGETGVGKGLVARMIHKMSSRAHRDFVDINCAALPANLMESELFGHEKGAFTGAIDRKLGLIEAADHGSVFLDEIRELDLTLQAKLLTLLDTQQFRRVGAVKPVKVDVRFIAATNKVLLSEVTSGRFREDLYYRLQVIAVNLPALRERGEDVLTLARHFIARFNKTYGRTMRGLSAEAEQIFLRYAWPGNVRELENLLERIFILEDENMILPRHLPDRILRSVSGQSDPTAAALPARSDDYHAATDSFQRTIISQAMSQSNGNPQEAAKRLGLSRHALRHQMTKLGLLKS
ncbi:MAG: sigma-54 interaction domain-containing protein [Paracoccaceae bacterium]